MARIIAGSLSLEFHDRFIGPASLPIFSLPGLGLEFVLIPGGSFAMGITEDEMASALRDMQLAECLDIEMIRSASQRAFLRARPVHDETVAPFLCARTPLSARMVRALGDYSFEDWFSLIAGDPPFMDGPAIWIEPTHAAAIIASQENWRMLTEAEWEWVARANQRTRYVPSEVLDHECAPWLDDDHPASQRCTTAWGVWGLGFGEFVADAWRDDYSRAAKPAPGAPQTSRGAGHVIAGHDYPELDVLQGLSGFRQPAVPSSVRVAIDIPRQTLTQITNLATF